MEPAEEVGEDALLFAEEGQAEGDEDGSRGKNEIGAISIIEVALSEVAQEAEEGYSKQEENLIGQRNEGEQDQEEMDVKTTKKESENVQTRNECSLVSTEIKNQQVLQLKEETEEEKRDQKEVIASVETNQEMEKLDKVSNYDEHVQQIDAPVRERAEGAQLWDKKTTGVASLLTTESMWENPDDVETSVSQENTAINEDVKTQSNLTFCSNGTIEPIDPAEAIISQASQLTTELQAELKYTDRNQLITRRSNTDTMQEEENTIEAMTENKEVQENRIDGISISDEDLPQNVLEMGGTANLMVEQLELDTFKKQSLSEKWTEDTFVKGVDQKESEEENVQKVGVVFLEGKKVGEEVNRGLVEEKQKDSVEMQEKTFSQVDNQATEIHPEPVVHHLEKVPVDKQQIENFEMAEVFELKERDDLNLIASEVPVKENKLTGATEGNLQKHPLKVLKRLGTDWVGNIRRHHKQKRLSKKKKGQEVETTTGGLEMAESPVTVLDNETDETGEVLSDHIKEEIPDTNSGATTDGAEVKGSRDQQNEKVEEQTFEKKNKENIEQSKKEDTNEKNDETRGNRKVKELKQAMEHGTLSLRPRASGKEELGKSKVLSLRRKDNAWIKKDHEEEGVVQETKEWRKDLRPVRKDVWETERRGNERMKKEPPAEENAKEDLLKELKSVIKDESLPKRKDEHVKKKRVVLLEDGHSYIPQREKVVPETKEEVQLFSKSPLSTDLRDSRTLQDQNYKISLYVKVNNPI